MKGRPQVARPIAPRVALDILHRALSDFETAWPGATLARTVGLRLLQARIADFEAALADGQVHHKRFRLTALLAELNLTDSQDSFKGGTRPQLELKRRFARLGPYLAADGRAFGVTGPEHRPVARTVELYVDLEEVGDVQPSLHATGALQERAAAVFAAHAEPLLGLLAIDSYPNGLWGYSIASSVAAFRHTAADPGSITVAQRALDALIAASGEELWEDERRRFTAALKERRVRRGAKGAVGMWRHLSEYAKTPTLCPHPRHTAVAVQWWATADHTIDYLCDGVAYLAKARADSGAWGDQDTDGDALTTANVLRTFLDLDAAGVFQTIAGTSRMRETYAEDGFRWLYENLRARNGWWILKTSAVPPPEHERTYFFSADIAATLPEFPTRGAHYAAAYDALLDQLFHAWRGAGIPLNKGAKRPDLGTTTAFARATWLTRAYHPELAERAITRYLDSVPSLLATGVSEAGAWAMTLHFLANLSGARVPIPIAETTRARAMALRADSARGVVQPSRLRAFPPWARKYARKILTARAAAFAADHAEIAVKGGAKQPRPAAPPKRTSRKDRRPPRTRGSR